jgi:copper homeostasis protein
MRRQPWSALAVVVSAWEWVPSRKRGQQPSAIHKGPLADRHEPTHFNNVAQGTSRFPTKIVNICHTLEHRSIGMDERRWPLCGSIVPVSLILEVIALDAADARAARDGGADRVELVADMDHDGLAPAVETFAAVRAAVDLPVRVMLRDQEGYALSDATGLRNHALALRRAGADQFVLGFLDHRRAVDLTAVETMLDAIDGCPWTFHRALDHAADRSAAWRALSCLPGLDYVLTAGCPAGVGAGIATLRSEAGDGTGPHLLVGGGLRAEHVGPLRAAGVHAFHSGRAVRPGGRWDAPVDAALVARWRTLIAT